MSKKGKSGGTGDIECPSMLFINLGLMTYRLWYDREGPAILSVISGRARIFQGWADVTKYVGTLCGSGGTAEERERMSSLSENMITCLRGFEKAYKQHRPK